MYIYLIEEIEMSRSFSFDLVEPCEDNLNWHVIMCIYRAKPRYGL